VGKVLTASAGGAVTATREIGKTLVAGLVLSSAVITKSIGKFIASAAQAILELLAPLIAGSSPERKVFQVYAELIPVAQQVAPISRSLSITAAIHASIQIVGALRPSTIAAAPLLSTVIFVAPMEKP